jgi:hypothetical protein
MSSQQSLIYRVAVLGLFVCVTTTTNVYSQFLEAEEGNYILERFKAQIGEEPDTGWFTPLKGFVAANVTANRLWVYGPLGYPSTVLKQENHRLDDEDLKSMKIWRGACEVESAGSLTAYDAGIGEIQAAQAFYTTKKLPGAMRSGLVSIPVTTATLKAVNALLGWQTTNVLRRDEAVAVRPGFFFYSFHKLYDSKTGKLSKEAVVLHDSTGRIIAHTAADGDPGCDGCGTPTYAFGTGAFPVLNIFELPGFAYPVLLIDSSTVEGRATSLWTFGEDLKVSTVRFYEYVVNCR